MTDSFVPRSRWASWEILVLAKTEIPIEAQQAFLERQGEIDDDNDCRDLVVAKLEEYMVGQNIVPITADVFITSADMARIIGEATGEWLATNKASTFIKTLGIPQLTKTKQCHKPGWRWRGSSIGNCQPNPRRPLQGLTLPVRPDDAPPPAFVPIDEPAESDDGANPA